MNGIFITKIVGKELVRTGLNTMAVWGIAAFVAYIGDYILGGIIDG
jgi:hypothetical protein